MSKMSSELGINLRRIRKEAGMTLADLATRSDCSKSLLSQIETGAVNPSFSSLATICESLGVTMGSLFGATQSKESNGFHLMRAKQRKTMQTEGGVNFQLLSKGLRLPCEFVMNRWPPGTETGKDAYAHEGLECGILLEGELVVETQGETHHLHPGDTVTFDSSIAHRVINPGKIEAVAIWLNTEPFIFAVT